MLIGNTRFEHPFYIVQGLTNNAILGVDFFSQYEAKLNFETNTLEINKDNITCKTNFITNEIHCIQANKKIRLKPHSFQKIPVQLKECFLNKDLHIMDETNIMELDLCITDNKNKTIQFPIYNNSDTEKMINKYDILASIHILNENEIYDINNLDKCNESGNVKTTTEKEQILHNKIGKEFANNQQLFDLLKQYQDIFSDSETDVGAVKNFECSIELIPNAIPIRSRPYPVNPKTRQIIEDELQKMLDKNIISPSTSIWSSPIVLVKKHTHSDDISPEDQQENKQLYRLCIDYRLLNKISKKMYYQMPTIVDVQNMIAEKKPTIFTKIDIKQAFLNLPMAENSKKYTAFNSPTGRCFQFNVLPYGLCNSPFYWSLYLSKILGEFNFKNLLFFLDDCILMSDNIETHIKELSQFLHKLKEAGLVINLKKSHFAQKRITFLGTVFEGNTIQMDPDKLKIINEFQIPNNQKGLKSFLGMTNFLKRFIKDYSHIVAPLNRLLKKDTIFKWTEEHDKSFNYLKRALMAKPILRLPDFNQEFTIYTDASTSAVGFILCQEDSPKRHHVILYGGRALKDNEKRYSSCELELLAIIYALKECRVYISNIHVKIITDNKALTFLHTAKHSNDRLYRWALELENYDHEIIYKTGKTNPSDYLSRINYSKSDTHVKSKENIHTLSNDNAPLTPPQTLAPIQVTQNNHCSQVNILTRKMRKQTINTTPTNHQPIISADNQLSTIPPDNSVISDNDHIPGSQLQTVNDRKQHAHLTTNQLDIINLQATSKDFGDIYAFLKNGHLPDDKDSAKRIPYISTQYEIVDNVLFHFYEPRSKKHQTEKTLIKQLALPESLRSEILYSFHDLNGHCGVDRMFATLKTFYYFPKMYQAVKDYVQSCKNCQIFKRDHNYKPYPLQEPFIASAPFDMLHIDIVTVAKQSKEYKYVLSVICAFSKFALFIPLKTQNTIEIAEQLYHKVFAIFGPPKRITSDRGQNFLSGIMDVLYKFFQIKRHRTSSYHPMSNGMVERVHSTLLSILRTSLKDESDWPDKLSSVQLAYNSTVCPKTTQYSPYYILFGRHMNKPITSELFPPINTNPSINTYVEELKQRFKLIWNITQENINNSRDVMRKFYNRKTAIRPFKLGDLVFIKQEKVPLNKSRKLFRKFSEQPYYITKILQNGTYILRERYSNKELKVPVNINRLRRYHDEKDLRDLSQTFKFHEKETNDNTENQNNPQTVTDNTQPNITATDKQNTINQNDISPKNSNKKWYKADKILKTRIKDNQRQYLIKWTNKKYKNSWANDEDTSEALIKQFYINKSLKKNHKRKR